MSLSPELITRMAKVLKVDEVVELETDPPGVHRLALRVGRFASTVEIDTLELRTGAGFHAAFRQLTAVVDLLQDQADRELRSAALIKFPSAPQELEFAPLRIDLGEKLYSEYLANISASAAATYGMPRDVIDGGESRPVVRSRFEAIALEMTEEDA